MGGRQGGMRGSPRGGVARARRASKGGSGFGGGLCSTRRGGQGGGSAAGDRWRGKPATRGGAPVSAEEGRRRERQGWFCDFPKSQGPN